MNRGHLVYLIFSIFMFIGLTSIIVLLLKGKSVYKKILLRPVFFALAAIPFYCVFILTKKYHVALFFNTLFYICTDWLAFYILYIAIAITDHKIPRKLEKVSYIIPVCDSISLFLNCFFNHTYDIKLSLWKGLIYYWHLDFYPLHYLHLGLCYIFVASTLALLLQEIIVSPSFYKKRYAVLFSAYMIVIVVNMICYNLNLPVDVSVLLYATISAFICYYANYLVPKTLASYTLLNFNRSVEDAIICYDINNQYLYSNPAADFFFDDNGKFDFKSAEKFRSEIIEKYGKIKEFISFDEIFNVKDSVIHCAVEYRELKMEGITIGSYLKIQDRTEKLNQLFKEHYIATHDQLTGIYNRDYFFEMCDKQIKAEPNVPRMMIASNVRDFKMLNELFGEKKGDELLCRQADILKRFKNSGNIFGRISDDKFALMISREDFILENFLKAIDEMGSIIQSSSYKMRIVMGICEFENASESASVLYDKAVLAMESMSEDYQQIYAYYDEVIMERLLKEKLVLSDFDKALQEDQFEILLETITDAEGNIYGLDTFVSWNHPEKGILRPEFFIPVLKKTGFIYRLDLYVWEKVISMVARWQKEYKSKYLVSINVSVSDFYYLDVADEIINLVKKYDADPEKLVVEFEENIISERFMDAENCISQLKNEKIKVAIDDFGRGVSSLKMIENFNADVIKVDMRMFTNKDEWDRSISILDFIKKISENLGTEVIAVNINSDKQFQELNKLNYSYFQCNYLAPRESVNSFEKRFFNNPK